MKIIRNDKLATWTFVPVETEEEQIVASIIAMLKPKDKLSYGGRSRDDEAYKFCTINLHAGAEKKPEIEVDGNFTIHRTVYVGGVKLTLRGTAEEDKEEIWSIRACCNYSDGLIFLGETEVEGKKAAVVTGGPCKHCGAGLLDAEWKTCDACAAKCGHIYVHGAIHGGGTEIGVGEFCKICGRGKPRPAGEREKSPMEQRLAAEKELGIPVFTKVYTEEGMYPMASKEIVEMSRLNRRHHKSLQRRNISA